MQARVLFPCEGARDTEDRMFAMDSGASMHYAEQRRELSSDTIGYFEKVQKRHMRLTATERALQRNE